MSVLNDTVLLMSAAPSTPEEVRQEIEARAAAGEKITIAEVERLKREARAAQEETARLEAERSELLTRVSDATSREQEARDHLRLAREQAKADMQKAAEAARAAVLAAAGQARRDAETAKAETQKTRTALEAAVRQAREEAEEAARGRAEALAEEALARRRGDLAEIERRAKAAEDKAQRHHEAGQRLAAEIRQHQEFLARAGSAEGEAPAQIEAAEALMREYLNRLHWDGTPRLEGWTVTHLGAEDTPLNRAFGSLWMISAVARIMQPGSKADHMLILEGPQGAKKSTALAVLAGDGWFTDELAEIGSKDAALQMRGVWIIEIAELDAIGRAEVSRIKAFLSRTVDRYRPPYDRYVVDVPRQCVFAGSVNPDTYLRDETGNRRFWPVRCGRIDLDALRRDRDQLWAEAVVRYREGAIWWIDDRDLITAANVEQEARVQPDAWHALIERWLVFEKRQVNRGYAGFDDWQTEEVERAQPLTDVSVGEILAAALGIEPGRWTRGDEMRVTAYLKSKGWERYRVSIGTKRDDGDGPREWRYRLKDKKSR